VDSSGAAYLSLGQPDKLPLGLLESCARGYTRAAVPFISSLQESPMLIIWGSRLYGKVDEVPGLFHVATKFGHLWYIPLIPMGSHLVVEKTPKGWRGAPLGLHFKSVLMAWLRAALLVGAVVCGIVAFAVMADGSGPWVVPAVLAALCVGGIAVSYRVRPFRFASYERAVALAEKIGLSPAGNVMLELAFGNITQEEAAQALARIKEREEASANSTALPRGMPAGAAR
jgi:hypothetical protein